MSNNSALSCCSPIAVAFIAAIAISAIGLQGGLSLHQVSVANLVTSIFTGNLPSLIVSALGLGGVVSMNVVAGVTIGTSALVLTFATCGGCIGGSIAFAKG